MWILKKDGTIYKDRKEAKEKLGHYNFDRLYKNKEIINIKNNKSVADFYGKIHTNSDGV